MTELHGPRGSASGPSTGGPAAPTAVTPVAPDAITLEAVLDGRLGADDVRMEPAALIAQAVRAEDDGNTQLGANLRRAAELVGRPDAEVLRIYEALRPSRSSAAELERIAASLDDHDAPLNAALVREAAVAYTRRGLIRPASSS